MTTMPPLAPLAPLEVATSLGLAPRAGPGNAAIGVRVEAAPLEVLERIVLAALQRQPCGVSFSGGRDSSAILAVATDLARREGLPLPVPITLRFLAERTQESEWQESVIEHLELAEWVHLDVGHDLGLIGPAARRVLTTLGVTLPPNLHCHEPIAQVVAGGSLLTGIGGDEIFTSWPWSRRRMASRAPHIRTRRAAFDIGIYALPEAARRRLIRHARPLRLPWLLPDARDEVVRWAARRDAAYVPTYQLAVEQYLDGRLYELFHQGLRALGALCDTSICSPFADPGFLGAVAGSVPPEGFGSRTAAMRQLFGHVLPEASVTRSTKAVFSEVLWEEEVRAFVASWSGRGIPDDLVDPELLRQAWQAERPNILSWTLLQAAWLNTTPPRAR